MLFLLLSHLLRAEPVGLDPATLPFFERAEAELSAGRPTHAATFYRLVLGRDPTFIPASLGLGRALEAAGDQLGAERVYRGMGDDPDATEALARLIESRDPREALKLWRKLETLRLGDATPHREQARILASTDLDGALAAWSTYLTLLQGAEPEGLTLLALADALIAYGRDDEGERLLAAYRDTFPTGAVAAEVSHRLDRLDIERAAAELPLILPSPLTPEQAVRVGQATEALEQGRLDEASELARALVAAAPRSPEAHGLLAEVLRVSGEWAQAESHARVARLLAPDDANARVRLAMLLIEGYGGRRNPEAATELREAVVLRPDEATFQYRLGLLEQALGNYSAAEEAFTHYLRLGGGEVDSVSARIAALQREPPPAATPPAGPLVELPASAAARYRIALELFGRGREAEALQELNAALDLAPNTPLLLNRKAAVLRRQGLETEAIHLWEQSLTLDPSQGVLQLYLGDVARSAGDRTTAIARYQASAAAGVADAHYLLAQLAIEAGEWRAARDMLAAYFARSTPDSPYRVSAAQLSREVETRFLVIHLSLGALGLTFTVGPLLLYLRRNSALILRDLLNRAPACWHEAARVLAGLRHEVLKHNTTVLPDVAAALERGDHAPWDALRPRAPGLFERFDAHLTALEQIGRRHGMRLDLRYRDPILGPMFRAMRKLARLRRPTPAELRAISRVINDRGYVEIGRIVREICVLPITPLLVRNVYERVRQEPGMQEAPELVIEEYSNALAVRMFRNDVEDILANLLRNAVFAGARRLSVGLAEEDDPITGVGIVELRVSDDAPGVLTSAMIRGRYIDRGLGLVVDIINRHGGSIRVDPGDGEKTIVVQLPRVEAAAVEVEWAG